MPWLAGYCTCVVAFLFYQNDFSFFSLLSAKVSPKSLFEIEFKFNYIKQRPLVRPSEPFLHEIAFLPSNVLKCCSSSQKLWINIEQCKMYNAVVKPKHRTIRGYNPDDCIMFALENIYHHLNTIHMSFKNPNLLILTTL